MASVCAVGGLTHCSTCLGSLVCVHLDTWIAACAGNLAETTSTGLLPSSGTDSPVSLLSSLLSSVLLPACFVREESSPSDSSCSVDAVLKKTALVKGRRESGLVSQSSSYFISISVIVSPENWHSDQNF